MERDKDILIYQDDSGNTVVEVHLIDETLWLTQQEMADLFQTSKQNISHHINKIFGDDELQREATVKKYLTVQKEGKRQVKRSVDHYNLDAIISVGYRLKSLVATKFRIWATQTLKDYIVKGYAINEQLLNKELKKYKDFQSKIKLLADTGSRLDLNLDEAQGLLKVIEDYSQALDILDRYDHQNLKVKAGSKKKAVPVKYNEAKQAIAKLKDQLGGSDLWQRTGCLNQIFHTFSGKELYPSLEEKAANLLYLLVKNHPFVDGNKRIAAFLFTLFLDKNALLYRTKGSKKITNNTLVGLVLATALSRPEEKTDITKVIINLMD